MQQIGWPKLSTEDFGERIILGWLGRLQRLGSAQKIGN